MLRVSSWNSAARCSNKNPRLQILIRRMIPTLIQTWIQPQTRLIRARTRTQHLMLPAHLSTPDGVPDAHLPHGGITARIVVGVLFGALIVRGATREGETRQFTAAMIHLRVDLGKMSVNETENGSVIGHALICTIGAGGMIRGTATMKESVIEATTRGMMVDVATVTGIALQVYGEALQAPDGEGRMNGTMMTGEDSTLLRRSGDLKKVMCRLPLAHIFATHCLQ